MAEYEPPPPKTYKGPSGIARDSVWLTNEDIPHDRDTVVTIETVNVRRGVKFDKGRVTDVVLSLAFVGKKRELALNATNRKVLAALFESSNTADWFGKTIALYVEQGVRRPDKTVGPAVRIRARRVEPKNTSTKSADGEDRRAELRRLAPDLTDIDMMEDRDVDAALDRLRQDRAE